MYRCKVLLASVALVVATSTLYGQIFDYPDINSYPACIENYYFYNKARRVTGAVNEECGNESPAFWHTAPFGNWGIDSNYTAKYDGYQFPGWKISDGWFQWNSCTTTVSEYRAPSPCHQFYNDGRISDNSCTTQSGTGRGDALHAESTTVWHALASHPISCTSLSPGVQVFNSLHMHVYELDNFPGLYTLHQESDAVTMLTYPQISVPLTCNSDTDECSGSSGWYSQASSSKPGTGVSASIKVRVTIEPVG